MTSVFASLTLVAATVAFAVEPAADVTDRPEEHCVIFVIGQKTDGEFITTDPTCFSSPESAALWGEIGLAAVTGLSSGGGTAMLTFDLGIHYDGFNGTGSSIRVVGGSCTGGYWNTTPWWDNRISSSYNGCYRLKHWDYPSKSGSVQSTTGVGDTDNLSYMNNRTESVSYHSS